MLRIVVCDDDLYVVKELVKLCEKYIESNHLNAECVSIIKPEEVFLMNPDILFLDIEMPEVDGIEVKNRLEERGSGTFIIFVSSHPDSMQEAFGKNVIGFLTKPLDVDQFILILEKALDFSAYSRMITFEDGSVISSEEIVAIKVAGNYTDVMAIDRVVKNQRKTLKAWMMELEDTGFVRISESYIINCKWITKILDGNKKVLVGGEIELTVTSRRRKECMEKYTQYCKRMARYL